MAPRHHGGRRLQRELLQEEGEHLQADVRGSAFSRRQVRSDCGPVKVQYVMFVLLQAGGRQSVPVRSVQQRPPAALGGEAPNELQIIQQ